MATGGLVYWKDGRDANDLMLALFDYPEGFKLSLRVNQVDGGAESEGFLFTGDEGTMEIAGNTVTVSRSPHATEPGYTVSTFAEAIQKSTVAEYRKKYPVAAPTGETSSSAETWSASVGYSDSYDHFHNFFNSVRTRTPVVEDAVFGFRAAGAALLSNLSVQKDAVIHWNPETMQIV